MCAHVKASVCVGNLVIMLNAWFGCRQGQCEVTLVVKKGGEMGELGKRLHIRSATGSSYEI